ncbi:MAG: hypothetical protein MJ133_04135 [Lachnospiraceae bacterium]|nr:hypothetical protein [Lachnospiraceae bacterium]
MRNKTLKVGDFMRMTNKIMQNNSLYNINQNKVLQDKLSTQMSTQKKLTRPSDDPVVAIRALRLRSSVSELNQYSGKNAPDAKSWLQVTADGLSTVTDILTDLSKNANKGANKDLTADDLDIIITQMRSLSDEFYATGNLDYAGRYVFTGYRTDTPMTFTTDDLATAPSYAITEQTDINAFDVINHTKLGDLKGTTATNYDDGSHDAKETQVENSDIHRLRLAYDNIEDGGSVTIKVKVDPDDPSQDITVTATASANPYDAVVANSANDNYAVFIPETGEVLFSDATYAKIEGAVGANSDKEIQVAYTKSEWKNGDLRPEHYYACTSTDNSVSPAKVIDYNQSYLTEGKKKQEIRYDVGYNQTIEINTTADEVFDHGLTRDVEDLETALKQLKEIDGIRTTLKQAQSAFDEGTAGYNDVQEKIDAANKAYTYIRENLHDLMQGAITKMQKYLDATNVAVTDNGTRLSRLDLISNRLTEQTTTFKTLQSENEDADIAEVAVNLTSAELTYQASLTATGKIMQTTLMNYI